LLTESLYQVCFDTGQIYRDGWSEGVLLMTGTQKMTGGKSGREEREKHIRMPRKSNRSEGFKIPIAAAGQGGECL
jgi:hypothetical protein